MVHSSPSTGRSTKWQDINALLISAVWHLSALVALGLISVAADRGWQSVELMAQMTGELDLPADDQQLLDVQITAIDPSTSAGPVQTFDVSPVATGDFAPVESVNLLTSGTGGLGGLGVGNLGDATASGGQLSSQFFGIDGAGRSFVYVVDCSDSMNEQGKFYRAREELLRSIEHLNREQRFFVIFYNDGAYPMDADAPVPATPGRLDRLHRWVNRVVPGGGTYPLPSLLFALSLEPDAVYFLSDGRFDPATVRELRRANRSSSGQIPIHTISFVNRETQGLMRAIARESGGEFRFVP